MKKTLLFAMITLPGLFAFSQSARMEIHDGMTLNVLKRSWENTLMKDAKFLKADKVARDEMVAARNEEILSGKIESQRNLHAYKVSKEHSPNGIDNYKYTTMLIGKEQSLHLGVAQDTLYIYRSRGLVLSGNENGSSGFSFEGVQKIPFSLALNDALPVYEDLQAVYPLTKKDVLQGHEETGGTIWTYKGLDKIDPNVVPTATIHMQVFNNVDAKVGRNEEFILEGKKYNAYVIESETWSKAKTGENFISSRRETLKAQNKIDRKINTKFSKENPKTEFTNEAGYIASAREEWFVPELGIVKIRNYDKYGVIVNENTLYSIR